MARSTHGGGSTLCSTCVVPIVDAGARPRAPWVLLLDEVHVVDPDLEVVRDD